MPGLGWRESTVPTSHHNPAQQTDIENLTLLITILKIKDLNSLIN
jgi:hypothetical protein